MGFGAESANFGITALLPMVFHEHPRVAMTNSVSQFWSGFYETTWASYGQVQGSSHVTRRRVVSTGPPPDALRSSETCAGGERRGPVSWLPSQSTISCSSRRTSEQALTQRPSSGSMPLVASDGGHEAFGSPSRSAPGSITVCGGPWSPAGCGVRGPAPRADWSMRDPRPVESLPPAGGGRPVGGRPRADSAGSSESLNLCAEPGQLHGKTRIVRGVARQKRVTRTLRMGGAVPRRDSAPRKRPREEWIEIPVPAIIDEPTFARAQELLHENKVHARRRTIEPSLVQGLVSCRKCGYAFSRISTRSTARRIQSYRCIGSDRWRHLAGPRCDARPVRQDLLDEVVWTEVLRLLEEPALIQQELDRRLAAARAADPKRTRTQAVERDLARVGKTIGRLLTAYQEDLVSLDQLRERMPLLRQREQTLRQELNALVEQTRDRAAICVSLKPSRRF